MGDNRTSMNHRARFLAREFLARYTRETGTWIDPAWADFACFSYEMGYMRGRSDGLRHASALYDETRKKVEDESK